MRLFRKRCKNNKGFSLVEVICAVAILGVTSTAIGSAMIVSTQNYQRGNAEVDVQKEAQTVTNLVGNLLVDAVDVDTSTDGTTGAQTVVIYKEGKEYTLTYVDNTISYKEKNLGDSSEVTGCLAENVTNFDLIAATDFENSDRNVRVDMEVTIGDKAYEASFTNTARSGKATNVGATQMARINLADSVVILEPGQTYDFNITVDGMTASEAGIVWSAPEAYDGSSNVGSTAWNSASTLTCGKLQVGTDAKGILAFTIHTDAVRDPNTGLPLDTRQVLVYIRRVNDINLTDTIKDASGNTPTGNNRYKAGVTYRIDAKALGTSLEKKLGLNNYDNDYVNPYYIDFTCEMKINDGLTVLNEAERNVYMTEVRDVQDTENPYFQFTLGQDMPSESEIIIKAKAKHPDGANKTGVDYGDVAVEYPIEYVYTPWDANSDLVRGSDGVVIMFDGAYYQNIKDTYHATKHKKTLRIYEAQVDAEGNVISVSDPIIERPLTDDGAVTHFQYADSQYFEPNTTYVIELSIQFLNDANAVVWPLVDTDPILYKYKHILGVVKMSYDCKQSGIGTVDTKKQTALNTYTKELMLFDGITWNELQAHIKFKKEMWQNDSWVELAEGDDTYFTVQNAGESHVGYTAKQAGTYRIIPYMENFDYKKPDGTTVTVMTTDLSTGGLGVLYLIAQ